MEKPNRDFFEEEDMNVRKNLAITALTLAATLLISNPAVAQLESLKANIPFAFYASGKLLPAGTYQITKMGGADGAIQLSGPTGSVYVLTGANTQLSAQDRLTFRRYGADSFLAGVSWSGSAGREIPVNKVEQRVAQAHARGTSTVAVNAR
jgi:hypothetical protein